MRTIFLLTAITGTLAFSQTKEFRQTVQMSASGHVSIDTFKGEVRVTTWDQPQVEVYARIEADGTSTEEREMVDHTDIHLDSTSDSVHLKSEYHEQHRWHNHENFHLPFVRYTIRMPRTAQLRIKDFKSEIEVSDLNASLEINTFKGDTKVHRLNGAIRMETFKGHGSFELASVTGSNRFETFKGVLDISVPKDAKFDVVSEGGRRSTLQSTHSFTIPAGSTFGPRGRLEARVNGGGPELVLKSYKGEVNLH